MKIKDLTGQMFGHLTVLSLAEKDKRQRSRWLCLCDCGKTTIVVGGELTRKNKRITGCGSKNY